MILYHTSEVQGLKEIKPMISSAYKDLGPVVFGSPHMGFSACFGGKWTDKTAKIGVSHSENTDKPKYNKVRKIVFVLDKSIELYHPCSLYHLDGSNFVHLEYDEGMEYVSKRSVKVLKEIKCKTWKELLELTGVEVIINK